MSSRPTSPNKTPTSNSAASATTAVDEESTAVSRPTTTGISVNFPIPREANRYRKTPEVDADNRRITRGVLGIEFEPLEGEATNIPKKGVEVDPLEDGTVDTPGIYRGVLGVELKPVQGKTEQAEEGYSEEPNCVDKPINAGGVGVEIGLLEGETEQAEEGEQAAQAETAEPAEQAGQAEEGEQPAQAEPAEHAAQPEHAEQAAKAAKAAKAEQAASEQPRLDFSESDDIGTYFRCHEKKSTAFAVLEASMLCGNGWLCGEAFRVASATMGSGDGKGLPPSPRDLTALLELLHRFLSVLFAAGAGRETQGDGEGVEVVRKCDSEKGPG